MLKVHVVALHGNVWGESPLQGLSRPMRVQVSLARSSGCDDPSLLEIESLFSRIQCISIVPLSIPVFHANEPNELQALKRPPRRNESPEGSAHHTISPLSQAVGKEQLRTRNRLDAMEKWRLRERMFDCLTCLRGKSGRCVASNVYLDDSYRCFCFCTHPNESERGSFCNAVWSPIATRGRFVVIRNANT